MVFLMLTLLLTAAFASSALAETMYVSTQDGDPLNVRSQPFISPDTLLGSIPNHSPVQVLFIDSNGWAKIEYYPEDGGMVYAYVSSRYLSYDQNGYYHTAQANVPPPTAIPKETEDKSIGRVNLRWAPNNKTRAIRSYPANYKLTVIGETANWYQVQDPAEGSIGFISKKLVTVVLPELEQ